ncbi:methylenetetrahydrofolate--tRNA-(uracil(54)-C(5))-methyltransferase (FADH(2)-oxidizing) TrmFO [Sulfoacidibacillus thermotolerans]|uniref:Methylenetetrahydrofolate--tRNA-(uracil-5-)-methyltransferase TrmFO n=1 Tax=Sulfoacidibacillus thermotolerans TaxID=1765684 RepID=A0A2U3DAF1_SULT2|nr:methylenetetrahydrofolate--tRNA-(uracil(54)-C(5))-methyltransferase (FADH(2)-oxidizing) TrmFO [Sulfoacidibacillus thermotolerans]PWI58267.1 methylenetetrahydrofolate--tRNA-(uracil(54)-C(5))-methyltransferase (FADH(2)-oxidizing) TrmFO [Sulfoacidibacillus thermotolerans]
MWDRVIVIGAGLAGSEAAWQIARRGVDVTLYEMRGVKSTPAHRGADFAELVCSNSLRAAALTNAVGLLKEEMRRLDSLIMRAADLHAVPAGGALAVDREAFSRFITDTLIHHPHITVKREEITELPEGLVVVATGPLTAERLSESILSFTGRDSLYFYDAAAPIIERDSIDERIVFRASRYEKGDPAYLNCPMTEEQFDHFYEALIVAEVTELKNFEKEVYFEGCMPIEVMAKRGRQTMLFGPLKPVGLIDPRTGRQPFAVVQLRQDNAAATLYNMVGFQTHLKWGEQARVFRMIPGLENAQFARYGVIHRNTFINSPEILHSTYQTRKRETLFFAGQMTGVEGYVESAASGLVAGINAARLAKGEQPFVFPQTTVIGSLAHYITHAEASNFQPMNATFGLLPLPDEKFRSKKEKNEKIVTKALDTIQNLMQILAV